MQIRIAISLAASAGAFLLIGCVSTTAFHTTTAPRPDANGRIVKPAVDSVPPRCYPKENDRVCISYAEFDDYGNPLNRKQMLKAADEAIAALNDDGLVLLFIHGWHNDSRPCEDVKADGCTRDVRQFIQMVERVSEMDVYKKRKVRGVYVGWRGDSIRAKGLTYPLSMLGTFWDRKAAAHQIGSGGGVYELISRVSDARRSNPNARLLMHGHSFGGAILYSALSQHLMDQIRRDERAKYEINLDLLSKLGPGDIRGLQQITPFADLVLLLNPAFEALRLRPQLDLARSQEYPLGADAEDPALPPRLVILTTEADWATGTMFPIGRWLSSRFDSYADSEASSENRTAVGHHIPYVTHQLIARSSCSNLEPKQAKRAERLGAASSLTRLCLPGKHSLAGGAKQGVELTRCDKAGECSQVAGQHFLHRGNVKDGHVPYRLPIMNVRTNEQVSNGHSDIRSPAVENFMLSLMELAAEDPVSVPFVRQPGAMSK